MRHALLLSLLLCGLSPEVLAAALNDPALGVTSFVHDPALSPATALEWAPDGSARLFVTLKSGTVRLIENGALLPAPFLTEPAVHTNSEGGLLGIAFDPDYLLNRYLYLFVSVSASSQAIVRYTDRGTYGDERKVIVANLPSAGQNHVGGGLGFGPDGRLYWGVGDLGNGTGIDADLTSMASKISRAEPDGRPASDNPFNDGVGPNNEFIYARGFRNPFGLIFHPVTGALWVNVAGTNYEQLFEVPRRGHAGYDDYEANQPDANDYIAPRIAYRTNGTDTRTITGAVRLGGEVTYTTSAPHLFRPGQRLTLSGMSDPAFNGVRYVRSVVSATSFTALQSGPDATSGAGSAQTDALGGAVTRGTFYDATLLPNTYVGNLLFGDYNSGSLVRGQFQGAVLTQVDAWGSGFTSNVDLSVGPDGAIYALGVTGGRVLRIAPLAPDHRIVLGARHVRVVEGSEGQVAVSLSRAPSSEVTVELAGTHPRLSVAPTHLTFTASDWRTPRLVRIDALAAAATDEVEYSLQAGGYPSEALSVITMPRTSQAFGVEPREAVVIPRGQSQEFLVNLKRRPDRTLPVTATLEGTASLLSVSGGANFELTQDTWSEGFVVEVQAADSETDLDLQRAELVIETPNVPPYRIQVTVPAVEGPDAGTDGGTDEDGGSDAGTDDAGTSDAGTDAGNESPTPADPSGCGCSGSGAAGGPLLLGVLVFLRKSRSSGAAPRFLRLGASTQRRAHWGTLTAILLSVSGLAQAETSEGARLLMEGREDEHDGGELDLGEMTILGPCALGSDELLEAQTLLSKVIRTQRALASEGSTHAFIEALRALRHQRCFRWPTRGWNGLDEADAQQLSEWWSAGGERWLRAFLEYGPHHRKVVLPPDVRRRLGVGTRLLLKNSLCGLEPSTCSAGDAWRARATSALQSIQSACNEAPKPCEVSTDASDYRKLKWPYKEWIDCSDDRLGRAIELPLDGVNPPTEGWLVVRERRGEGAAAGCRVAAAYSLATGEMWRIDTCGSVRTQVGRVPVIQLRELALLMGVSDELEYEVRARAVELEVPKDLEPSWPEWRSGGVFGGVIGGVIGCEAAVYRPVISWRISTGGRETLGDYQPGDCHLLPTVAERWRQDLDRQWVKACPTVAIPPRLFARPDRRPRDFWEPEDREQKTWTELEALMRKVPEGCPASSSR